MSTSDLPNGSPSAPPTNLTNVLLAEDYVEEAHIKAFADALEADELYLDQPDGSSPNIPGTPMSPTIPYTRVRKVAALSDFAPVNTKVKRRKKNEKFGAHGRRNDYLFLLLRWPLLGFIFVFIAAEFGLYVFIRQLVNTKEWITAWRGKKGVLRKKLRASRNYQEWKEAAMVLDEYLEFDEWKKVDEDTFYDWRLVKKVRRSLRTLREKKDARGCLGVLETCIRANFAGIESTRLYSETFLGTKDLIESYFTELGNALEFIRETPELSVDEKKRFFRSANTNLGTSALCLSGGASFGYYHVGVVKAFLDAGLLPRVVTGTSAGGLIAALVCTRTDEELKALLVPDLAERLTACEEPFEVWFKRLRQTGARFDSVLWARKCTWFTRGSVTFKEAYLRTGRILNISVIPADRHSPTKLLNYMTAPDTLIWTALLASAAVPGILNPVVLLHKLKDSSVVPWNWGSRFKDGSLRVDIPLQSLNLYFNVTNPVVSQVNPHVHLFFFAPRGSAGRPVAHRKGKGWRGNFLLSAAEQWLKHELSKNFKVIRDLELLPQLLGQDWSSVFVQRFDGAVTIWPKTRFWDWVRILSDPDPPELERMIRVGEIVTWPKLHMIENRAKIEREIFLGRQYIRMALRGRNKLPDSRSLHLPCAPSLEAQTRSSSRANSPHPNSSDQPISVDPDAEAAFSRGSSWFYRRGHPRSSPSPPSEAVNPEDDNAADPLRNASIRRKWTSELLSPNSNGPWNAMGESSNPTVGMSAPRRPSRSRTGSFLSRFSSKSFSNLTSTLSGTAKRSSTHSTEVSDHGISDSSSDDEDVRRYQRQSSALNLLSQHDDSPSEWN